VYDNGRRTNEKRACLFIFFSEILPSFQCGSPNGVRRSFPTKIDVVSHNNVYRTCTRVIRLDSLPFLKRTISAVLD